MLRCRGHRPVKPQAWPPNPRPRNSGGHVCEPACLDPLVRRRKLARSLSDELSALRAQLKQLGGLTVIELEQKRLDLEDEIRRRTADEAARRTEAERQLQALLDQVRDSRDRLVATEETAALQEVGVYQFSHPLQHAVAYQHRLVLLQSQIKAMCKKEGGAVLAATGWTVNGSEAQGRVMVREYSKLMLRAFNAEADTLVASLRPDKVDAAVERLRKASDTIAKLGKTMGIRIAEEYLRLRVDELRLTADYLQKKAEEKEAERVERERLREERRVHMELERERARLEKERQHYANAMAKLVAQGDMAAIDRMQHQLADVEKALADVAYREANIRAGYVYVISNIGAFGERMVKVGMTRRLDPTDRIRELSDASVPFNFDIHALFFANDAVTIETTLHARLAAQRINMVNRRREFFQATPAEVKQHLADLAGDLLEFVDLPAALEYRQSVTLRSGKVAIGTSSTVDPIGPVPSPSALNLPQSVEAGVK
jgi:hypothetical protein